MKLKRTKQCRKCPWKKGINPHDIPNGYDIAKHQKLSHTIADKNNPLSSIGPELRIMACHETERSHCVGWLYNQLGEGNNIALRLLMRNCENISELTIVGEQHDCFDDTLPETIA